MVAFERLTIAQRITKGSAYLTRKIESWKSMINIRRLDIDLPESCILGQTDTDFFEHKRHLGLTDRQCADFGFLGYNTLNNQGSMELTVSGAGKLRRMRVEHAKLTRAWKLHLIDL